MLDPDHQLDAQLRDVPLPDGLIARLKESLLPSDDELDAALRVVLVPTIVLARLHEVPADLQVDEALADVPAPMALVRALRRSTWTTRLRSAGKQMQRLAIAALWFLAISAVLAGGLGSILTHAIPQFGDQLAQLMKDRPIPIVVSESEPDQAANVVVSEADPPAPGLSAAELPWDAPEPGLMHISLPQLAGRAQAGPVGEWNTLVAAGLRPMDDAVVLRYGVLGSPYYSDDQLPDLIMPRLPEAAGIEPPRVRGYDRGYFLKHRVFPPLSPAAHPRLADLEVPLITGSDALSRIERSLAENRIPVPHDIRVEELIAAMDYRLAAAPAGRLALRTAAGPSLFGPPESGLLFVGVQAGGFARRPQPVTHLVLALDLSHSMSRAGRLEMAQQAISRLLAQVGPQDRISLVVFNEEVTQVVEAATPGDAASVQKLLGELSPRGGTNLAAGLQRAASLAMSDLASADAAQRLVLITDSQAVLDPDTRSDLEQLLLAAGEAGVKLDVLDLSQRSQIDSTLYAWAEELQGSFRPVSDARQMYRLLLEILSGGEATIARRARLKLHFNPEAVAAYRLVGHEANSLADLTPPSIETDLSAGEAAAALVELWFLPGDANDLGYCELTWNDREGGPARRIRQPISRLQFAPTASEAPLPLVQAALAAELGETLRGSQEALRLAGVRPAGQRGLREVLQAAADVNPELTSRPDFRTLLDLARQLQRQGVR